MNKLLLGVTNYSKLIVVGVLLLTLPLAHFYEQQRTHNTIEVFFEKDNPDLKFYKKFRETFGNEERSIIIFEDKDIFTQKNIELIKDLSNMALSTQGVRRVISLTEQTLPRGDGEEVIFSPVVPSGDLSSVNFSEIKKSALSSELLDSLVLISDDASMTAIIMEFDALESNEAKGELQGKIISAAEKIAGDRVRLLFTGTPIIENELNTLGNNDNEKFGPITLLMILVVAGITLRAVSLTLLCFFNVVFVSIWSLGFYFLMGETLNLVTMMIPPVLISIAVADSIHLLAHYKRLASSNSASRYENMRRTIEVMWLPCLLTSVTTALGFLSFITSPVRPVTMVGIYMAVGVFVALALTFTFIPAAMTLFKKNKPGTLKKHQADDQNVDLYYSKRSWVDRLLEKMTINIFNHYKKFGIAFAAIFLLTFIGISKVEYITNFTSYMPEDNTIRKDMEYIDERYGGTVPIEIVLQANSSEKDFTHPHSLRIVEEVQNAIGQHMKDEYTSSFSIVDYFKAINKSFNGGQPSAYKIPDDRLDVLDFYEIGEPDDINAYVSSDKMKTRISFQCINGPFDINVKLENFIGTYLPAALGNDYSYKVTGYGRLYVDMDANLKESQINSLTLAFVVVFVIMLLITRNIKFAMLTMIPNLFPVGLILGIMGWLNIPFDVATIMVATMTLGIAVDDTIHYIVWYKRNIEVGLPQRDALIKTVYDTGKPILMTSIILFFGFAVMVGAQTLPLQFFGLLTALSMLFAVIGDLIVLPVLILLFKPQIKPINQGAVETGFREKRAVS